MKYVKIAGVATILVIALAVLGVTLAFAQKPTPTDNPWWKSMRNMMQRQGGMMGGRAFQNGGWESMGQMHDQMTQNGGMGAVHDWMHQNGGVQNNVWAALADQLGLTAEELTEQINSGKTLAQVAEEKGVSTKDLAATMENGMKTGLAQAVENGKLTQDQADQMLENMDGQYEWMLTNMGAGMMGSGGGMMGPGAGGCHDYNQTPDDDPSL